MGTSLHLGFAYLIEVEVARLQPVFSEEGDQLTVMPCQGRKLSIGVGIDGNELLALAIECLNVMPKLVLQLLDGRRFVVVGQHVVGHYSQLENPLHANGEMENAE